MFLWLYGIELPQKVNWKSFCKCVSRHFLKGQGISLDSSGANKQIISSYKSCLLVPLELWYIMKGGIALPTAFTAVIWYTPVPLITGIKVNSVQSGYTSKPRNEVCD